MKFIACGDLHITHKKPQCRKEKDFFATVLHKFKFMYEYALNNEIAAILQPGDFFDSSRNHEDSKTRNLDPTRVSHKVVASIVDIMTEFSIPTYWVAGQHDMRFHNIDNPNTPINVLKKARLIHQAGVTPIQWGKNIHIYGAAWDYPVPEIIDHEKINILLIHKMMIYRDNKLWKGQTDYSSSNKFLDDYGFNIVISGDNHQSFIEKHNGNILINCGSMLRTNIKQVDHIPCFYVVDFIKGNIQKVEFPIEAMEVVIDRKTKDIKEEVSEELQSFIDQLPEISNVDESGKPNINFKSNIHKALKHPDMDPDVRIFINSMLGE